MQHMQDKDFDNLFRDKFMNAEIEPSANLWAKIEDQLEPKRKRVLPIYWMAAASVAVAFTTLMVFQKSDKIQLRPDEVTAAIITSPVEQNIPTTTEEAIISTALRSGSVAKSSFASTKTNMSSANNIENAISENNQLALQPNSVNDRLPIKQADAKPIDVVAITQVENPIVIAQVEPQQKVDNDMINEIDNTSERKGIRNVGDLVNYVVDRVDKRDKKLVRFNTDDDDNSSIVGINIGFLKFNKKKN